MHKVVYGLQYAARTVFIAANVSLSCLMDFWSAVSVAIACLFTDTEHTHLKILILLFMRSALPTYACCLRTAVSLFLQIRTVVSVQPYFNNWMWRSILFFSSRYFF